MKIYTRGGDFGTTSLYSGERVSKANLRIEICGTLDELNSSLGVVRTADPAPAVEELLAKVQSQLFYAGAGIATTGETKNVQIGETEIKFLEREIDRMSLQLPKLVAFILPGGAPAAAHLHVARAICRRAERLVVLLGENESIGSPMIAYLNRLSDFLFTLARWENFLKGVPETKWNVEK